MQTTSPRLEAIEALGGGCYRCGYATDSRVLMIASEDGDAERKRFSSRDAYYLYVSRNAGSGRWSLICHNCQFLRMQEARVKEAPKEEPLKPVFVWQTDLPKDRALVRSAWLDKASEDMEVYIVLEDGGVYVYPSGHYMAASWEVLAKAMRLGPLPKEASGVVERGKG